MAITVRYDPVSALLGAAVQTGRGHAQVQRFQMEQQLVQQALANQHFQDQLSANQYNQEQNRQLQVRRMQLQSQLTAAKQRMVGARFSRTRHPLQRAVQQMTATPPAYATDQTPGTGNLTTAAGERFTVGPTGSITGLDAQGQPIPAQTHFMGATPQQPRVDPLTAAKTAFANSIGVSHLPQNVQQQIQALAANPAVNVSHFQTEMRILLKQAAPHAAGSLTDVQRADVAMSARQVAFKQHELQNLQKNYPFTAREQAMSVSEYNKQFQAPVPYDSIDNSWNPLSYGVGGMSGQQHHDQLEAAQNDKMAAFAHFKELQQQIAQLQQGQQTTINQGDNPNPQNWTAPNGQAVTIQQIMQTAQARNMSPQQVIAALKLRPAG